MPALGVAWAGVDRAGVDRAGVDGDAAARAGVDCDPAARVGADCSAAGWGGRCCWGAWFGAGAWAAGGLSAHPAGSWVAVERGAADGVLRDAALGAVAVGGVPGTGPSSGSVTGTPAVASTDRAPTGAGGAGAPLTA